MKIHIMKVMWFRVEMGYLTLFRELVSLLEEFQFALFCQVFYRVISSTAQGYGRRHVSLTMVKPIFRYSFQPPQKMKNMQKSWHVLAELVCW